MIDTTIPTPPTITLMTCPFCDGAAALHVESGVMHGVSRDNYFTGCINPECIIRPITGTYATKRDAARAWNTRGPQDKSNPLVAVGGRIVSVEGGR